MNRRLGVKDDIEAITKLVQEAIKEMEKHDIFQWDEIYPTAEDFNEDIIKGNLLLFVTLPASNYQKILQIKRRYSLNYSDASYVRLF